MTSKTMLIRKTAASVLAALLLATSGCAVLSPKTPEQRVSTRAADFWEARRTGNFEKAYSYATPAYRKLKTAEQYKLQFGAGVGVKEVQVNKVVCEPQRCDVQMRLSVTPALIGLKIPSIDTYVNEIWLLEEGQWWHFQEL